MTVTRKVGALLGAVVVAMMVGACGPSMGGGGGGGGSGGGNGSGGDGGNGPGSNPGPGSGGSSSMAAPKILSLHTNVTSMTPTDTLVISVVVTDPDGINDVIGGDLLTADGVAAYGSFATDASEGAYSISVPWGELNTVAPINFGAGGSESRTLRAEFYDVEGNSTWREVAVALGCGHGATVGACNGSCVGLTTNDNCGACGATCDYTAPCGLGGGGTTMACVRPFAGAQTACVEQCSGDTSCHDARAVYDDNSSYDLQCAVVPWTEYNGHFFIRTECDCY